MKQLDIGDTTRSGKSESLAKLNHVGKAATRLTMLLLSAFRALGLQSNAPVWTLQSSTPDVSNSQTEALLQMAILRSSLLQDGAACYCEPYKSQSTEAQTKGLSEIRMRLLPVELGHSQVPIFLKLDLHSQSYGWCSACAVPTAEEM